MSVSSYSRTTPRIVKSTIVRHAMIEPSSSVVVGVSGGPDSVALLHILHELSGTLDFRIIVAHLDHALRSESRDEAEFVMRMAGELGVPVFSRRVEIRTEAAKLGLSIEEAGRRIRYEFFDHVRTDQKACAVATAHHRDDSLETFFLRILRGSSLRGLRGIPAKRGTIIRPLIRLARQEILSFLRERGIAYATDQTNLEACTDRNFIRNRVFPLISERFPDFVAPLERTMELIDQEDRVVEELAEKFVASVITMDGATLVVDLAKLRETPEFLRGRVVLRTLYRMSGPDVRWSKVHVDAVLKTVEGKNPSATTDLPREIRVSREYDRLLIQQLPLSKVAPIGTTRDASPLLPLSNLSLDSATLAESAILVHGPGEVEIVHANMTLAFHMVPRPPDLALCRTDAGTALFDADQALFPLTVRFPRPGDRFRPWGTGGSRKLKKVLIDAKIPLSMRRTLPLLVNDQGILWIPGIARGSAAPIKPETKRVLEVSVVHSGRAFGGEKGTL